MPAKPAAPVPSPKTSDSPLSLTCAMVAALGRVDTDLVDLEILAKAQRQDPEFTSATTSVSGLKFRTVKLGTCDIVCDMSTKNPRPWVPGEWRRRIFNLIHGLAHVGPRPTLRAVSDRFVWHGLHKDVMLWSRSCLDCQASKVSRHVRAPLQALPTPDARFDHVHVDLVGPLPSSEGKTYLFTMEDRFTR